MSRSASPEVLVVGESLVDLVQTSRESAAYPGGSPMNVAYGLAKLGRDVELLTRIGDDEHGRLVLEHLRGAGLRLTPGSIANGPTSTAVARLDSSGAASYEFDIRWEIDSSRAPEAPDILHVGSIAACLSPGAEQVFELVRSSSALVSYDPNIRPTIIGPESAARDAVRRYCDSAHIVKLSEEDAAWLFPGEGLDRIRFRLLDSGVQVVLITLGSAGCIVSSSSASVEMPAMTSGVIDTIGAGDSFMSGVLDATLRHELGSAVRSGEVGEEDLLALAVGGTASSAVTVSQAGAALPSLEELQSSASSVRRSFASGA